MEVVTLGVVCGSGAVLLVLFRLVWIWNEIRINRSRRAISPTLGKVWPIRTLLVLGSGGHTTELLFMTRLLQKKVYELHYCKADSDSTSADRLRTIHGSTEPSFDIPRAREVGQSYLSSIGTTLGALRASVAYIFRLKPQLILCNGPGTCIPIVLAAFLWRFFGGRVYFVFVESYCRVQSLSLTGKLLYSIVDMFVVHWSQLQVKYPNSVLTTTFIGNNNDDSKTKEG